MSTQMNGQSRYTATTDQEKANKFAWGQIQWLISGELVPNANITFGYVEIESGRKNPRHVHPNSDEVLYLLEGELEHSVGDELFHLTPGMAIFIPQGAEHDALSSGAQTARMVVAYPTGDRQAVMLETGDDR
jgi:quercetin dioxygenase-like cupin family protein